MQHRGHRFRAACVLALALGFGLVSTDGETARLKSATSVGEGWHPWYEIKADPESATNLIICGTKWDSRNNSPFGFVYASEDGGATWRLTLEDRNSNWVTEQSCTFGPHHSAYLISEASRVVDGMPHHEEGKTRLFLSTDAGRHWTETIKTGWADYSTSAFSPGVGKIYTLFNAWYTTHQPGSAVGGTVGLLVFSLDGKKMSGPFLDNTMGNAGYHGVFPMDATPLKSGDVVALYAAKRETRNGWQEDLGIVRAHQAPSPSLKSVVVAHPTMDSSCFNFADASLAYDWTHDQLFLVYVDGCKTASQILMTTSGDEGRTWTQSAVVIARDSPELRLYSPILVASPRSGLALLWEEGRDRRSGRWLFSYMRDSRLSGVETELSTHSDNYEVRDDSLWTTVDRIDQLGLDSPSGSTLTLTVLSELNNVWRGRGLIATGNELVAIWPSQNNDGQQLNAGILGPVTSSRQGEAPQNGSGDSRDVSQHAAMLFGGSQHFDDRNGILEVCLTLANRGKTAFRIPIVLEAEGIHSPIAEVSILNASNRLSGVGAKWDISSSVTGAEIPPGTTSNPFCLALRLQLSSKGVPPSETDELVVLKLKVFASNKRSAR